VRRGNIIIIPLHPNQDIIFCSRKKYAGRKTCPERSEGTLETEKEIMEIDPKQPSTSTEFRIIKWVLCGILVLLLLTVFRPLVIVPAGHAGVMLNFGAVKETPLREGIHFRVPIYQKVVNMDCRVQKAEHDAAAASRDLQTVTSKVAVNYHVELASAAILYQRVGPEFESRVIAPAIQESIKAVTARYTAEELITRRPEVATKTSEMLTAKLSDYHIAVDRFNIVNFEFSKEFNKAIEEKQTAEQRALKAQRDLERIKIEAEQKVTQARAEAEALRIQREQVTAELLRLREIENQRVAIEKWDGKLPKVSGGAVPFIDLENLE